MPRLARTVLLASLFLIFGLLGESRAWFHAPARQNPACETPSLAWQLRSDTATVWLMGSIHFATPATYPLCPDVEQAFARAEALAVELDTEARAAEIKAQVVETAFLPRGQTLSALLPETVRGKARELGIDLALFERFQPWYFALVLQVQKFMELGYLPAYGIDLHFLGRAKERGLPILEFETAESQLALLRQLAAQDTEIYLLQVFDELGNMGDLANGVFTAWTRGDANALDTLLFGPVEEHPEYAMLYERVFYERNARMAGIIAGYLEGDRDVFVVVGAGHLVGERSILDELAGRGYAAEQLKPL